MGLFCFKIAPASNLIAQPDRTLQFPAVQLIIRLIGVEPQLMKLRFDPN
jgi:hypothetical protein